MYIPAHFVNRNEPELHAFIRANSFGIIVSAAGDLRASHIPLELAPDGKTLSGHLSKANPQGTGWKDGDEVLCIFNGPHTYISSSWYNHENVPTWNYIAVHVRGLVKIISEEVLYNRLAELVDKYESSSEKPVSVQTMSRAYLDKNIKAITGFEVAIQSMEAAYKLSQNRDAVNHTNIIRELEKRGDHSSSAIAEEMKKRAPKA